MAPFANMASSAEVRVPEPRMRASVPPPRVATASCTTRP